MTRQTWTAAVSALLFVICAAVIAMTPVPFVTYSPGPTHDLLGTTDGRAAVQVHGVNTHPTRGALLVTTVSVTRSDAPVSLPEVLFAHWAGDREVFPRDAIYPEGSTTAENHSRDAQLMATSQADASASALRAAGVEVRQVPMVQSVSSAGPAVDLILPGDVVLAVEGVTTPTPAAVRTAVERRSVGDPVTFTILRDRTEREVIIETAASNTQAGVPVWGGTLVVGYTFAPQVSFAIDSAVVGSSAGLMLALAVFDRVTEENLIGDRVVAGTGTIDGAGTVGVVGGVREKLSAAEQAGATVFLVPSGNCTDLAGRPTRVRIVSVTSLDNAIAALDALADPSTEGLVEGCP